MKRVFRGARQGGNKVKTGGTLPESGALTGEMVRLPFYDIRYLDVHQNYVTVHAGEDYRVKRTLSEFEKELDSRLVHPSSALILNLKISSG